MVHKLFFVNTGREKNINVKINMNTKKQGWLDSDYS